MRTAYCTCTVVFLFVFGVESSQSTYALYATITYFTKQLKVSVCLINEWQKWTWINGFFHKMHTKTITSHDPRSTIHAPRTKRNKWKVIYSTKYKNQKWIMIKPLKSLCVVFTFFIKLGRFSNIFHHFGYDAIVSPFIALLLIIIFVTISILIQCVSYKIWRPGNYEY